MRVTVVAVTASKAQIQTFVCLLRFLTSAFFATDARRRGGPQTSAHFCLFLNPALL